MSEPVDPTTTPAWARLTALYESLQPDLRGWFAADPSRAKSFTFQAGDLYVDLSKNLINSEILAALVDLADQVGLAERRDAMFAGEHINVTEDRAVLHTALQAPRGRPWRSTGSRSSPRCMRCSTKVYAFADKVRSGEWTGVTGKPIATVVNIGIGGSDLGPVMVYEALKPYVKPGLKARFVSNIDPTDVAEKTKDLNPATTLFIVASKTFTTLETLTNARMARAWLLDGLLAAGAIHEGDEAAGGSRQALRCRVHRAGQGGRVRHRPGRTRSASGTGSAADTPSTPRSAPASPSPSVRRTSPTSWRVSMPSTSTSRRRQLAENVPALMGLLNVWYVNFFDAPVTRCCRTRNTCTDSPAYLQQLTMESNGKGVR